MTENRKELIKNIASRAAKTFIQAFLSAISVDAVLGVTDFDALKRIGLSMLVAGIAAGVSALWNSALGAINSRIEGQVNG